MLNSNASSSNENCQLLPSLKDVIVSYSSNTNNTQFEQSFKNQLLLDDNREDIVFNDKDHITVQVVTTMIKRKQNVGIYESSDDDDEEEQENKTNNTDEANDIELLTEDFIATRQNSRNLSNTIKINNNTNI
ncbi:hypothetical protein ABK040_004808 [Willaertia magna]